MDAQTKLMNRQQTYRTRLSLTCSNPKSPMPAVKFSQMRAEGLLMMCLRLRPGSEAKAAKKADLKRGAPPGWQPL